MSGLMFFGMAEPPALERRKAEGGGRADSPDSGGGGYFTLSDSGTESPQEDEVAAAKPSSAVPPATSIYKIFRVNGHRARSSDTPGPVNRSAGGSRSRSETPLRSSDTPTRPSPPKDYAKKSSPPPRPSPPKSTVAKAAKMRKGEEDAAPPRPPPPILYTSTLPPPVPKKMGRGAGGSRYASKTLPARRVSAPKPKPLNKLQPLQVQYTQYFYS